MYAHIFSLFRVDTLLPAGQQPVYTLADPDYANRGTFWNNLIVRCDNTSPLKCCAGEQTCICFAICQNAGHHPSNLAFLAMIRVPGNPPISVEYRQCNSFITAIGLAFGWAAYINIAVSALVLLIHDFCAHKLKKCTKATTWTQRATQAVTEGLRAV